MATATATAAAAAATDMTIPFQYQREGAAWIETRHGRALIADEQGLGKSFEAFLWAKRNPDVRPIVVVCPAILKWNWAREAALHIGMRAEIIEGRTAASFGLVRPQLVIINYDILHNWIHHLQAIKPQLLILDEIQALANVLTLRTRTTRRLCRTTPYVVALSGTPITKRPIDLWSILNMLRPDRYPNRLAFAEKYCQARKTPWGWDYSGAKNLDQLHAELTHPETGVMIRRLKKDVMAELPAKRRIVVPIEVDHREEYDRAQKDFLVWLGHNFQQIRINAAKRARYFAKIAALRQLIGKLKLKPVHEWIEAFLSGGDAKLIVFGHHKNVLHPLHSHYPADSVLVDGDVVGKAREQRIDRFKHDTKCRLLFGNIQAAGVGWNAINCSDTAFAEMSWKPTEHNQAEERTHGVGRGVVGKISTSYYLLVQNTIEERICKTNHLKQQISEQVLDGTADPEGFSSILNQLADMSGFLKNGKIK
jgi:SWI/SNF-related matrix-associated actin-dependent regulator of chromatin subfamily A-like protein 1